MAKYRTIGAFEILDELGEGDVGTYLLGEHLSTEEKVIIEELFEKYAQDDNFEKRYNREVQASELLPHENILKATEFGRTENSIYVASEYKDGLRLNELLEKSPKLPVDVACSIIHQVSTGLKVVHAKGIVHRNLKPIFLFVTKDGTVKIADFGLAQGNELGPIFISKKQLGTAYYLSSELASGKKVDHRSDIFSLGIIFYEILAGFNPFKADDFTTIVRNVQRLTPKPLTEEAPKVPAKLSDIVGKMLAKDRNQRYMNINQVLTDIEAMASSQNIQLGKNVIANFVEQYMEATEEEPEPKKTLTATPPPPPPKPEPKPPQEDLIDFGGEEPTPPAPEGDKNDLVEFDLGEEPPKEETPAPPQKEETFPDFFESSETPPEKITEEDHQPEPLKKPGSDELSFASLNEEVPGVTTEETPEIEPETPKPEPPPEPKKEEIKETPKPVVEGPFLNPEIELALFGPEPKMPANLSKPKPRGTPTPAAQTPEETKGGIFASFSKKQYILAGAAVLLLLLNLLFILLTGNQKRGTLLVKANPADATVLLNGIVKATESPCKIANIFPGEQTIEIRKKGKATFKTDLLIEPGQKYFLDIDLDKIQKKSTTPSINVTEQIHPVWIITQPPGAKVYLDLNQQPQSGTTPMQVQLTNRIHTIALELEGYQKHSSSIDFSKERIDSLIFELAPATEQPTSGTEIAEKKKPTKTEKPELILLPSKDKETEKTEPPKEQQPKITETTPKEQETPEKGTEVANIPKPEVHERIPAYTTPDSVVSKVATASFEPETEIIDKKSPAEMSSLDVRVSFWAEIYVDGQYMGVTPLVKPLLITPGSHVVKITMTNNPEFQDFEGEFHFKKGETIVINENDFKKK